MSEEKTKWQGCKSDGPSVASGGSSGIDGIRRLDGSYEPLQIVRPLESIHLPIVRDQSEMVDHLRRQVADLTFRHDKLVDVIGDVVADAQDAVAVGQQYRTAAMVAVAYMQASTDATDETSVPQSQVDQVRHMLATLDAKE